MKKGFTLVELLIVIGILAILATAAVVVLNPTELLKQARDSQRVADLDTLSAAISLYLVDINSPDLTYGTSGDKWNKTAAGTCPLNSGTCDTSTSTAVTGAGWVTVDFTAVSGGAPIAALPMDPVNDTTNFYAYGADESANHFEINAKLESTKFGSTGENLAGTDGGDDDSWYEIGNHPGLGL